MLKKKQGRMAINTVKKLDGKYLFTRFYSNTEVAVSKLKRGKLNTDKMFTTVQLCDCHRQLMKPMLY